MNKNKEGRDANRDPLTGEPGSHPVGTGIGAAGGGAAGAAVGAVGGPVGSAIGAVIGAVAGGLAGKGVAEAVDPTVEDAYWREHHREQPFAKDRGYDEYAPAYRTGYEGFGTHGAQAKRFEDAEPHLRQSYEQWWREHTGSGKTVTAGTQPLAWDDARPAAQAAWNRVQSRRTEGAPIVQDSVNTSKGQL